MPGFSRLDIRFLLVAILIVAGICSAHAERWQIGPESGRCPVQRLDSGAQAIKKDQLPQWVPVETIPPSTETAQTFDIDPPTAAGFAGPDIFVCCSQGAADHESCTLIDLCNDRTSTVVPNEKADSSDWLKRLEKRAVWPFPGIEIVWSEELDDEGTVFKAALRHRASGATAALGEAAFPDLGGFRLWGVRTAPDGSRFALICHAYTGEYSNAYPIFLFAANGALRAVYLKAAQILTGCDSQAAERMARVLSPPPSKKTD
jgi:hypothetical protein